MIDIKISQLRLFVAVADCASVSLAAQQLGRTPSAISMALKQFEGQLGAPLFLTERKDVLTDLGQYVRTVAESHLRAHERLTDAISSYERGEIGRLDICAVPSVAFALLPEIITRFTRDYPNVWIDARDTDTRAMSDLLKVGVVEVGIGGLTSDPDIRFQPLFADRLMLVAPPDAAGPSSPVDMDNIVPTELLGNGIIDDLFWDDNKGYGERSRITIRNTTSLLAMVRSGAGSTILPELAIPSEDVSRYSLRQIGDPPITRDVGLLTLKERDPSPVAKTFIAFLEKITLLTKDTSVATPSEVDKTADTENLQ